jgi:uncharacterized membrane-anchored protein
VRILRQLLIESAGCGRRIADKKIGRRHFAPDNSRTVYLLSAKKLDLRQFCCYHRNPKLPRHPMISTTHLKVSGSRLTILAFAFCAFFSIRPGMAQQQMLQSQRPGASGQLVTGPTKVNVADPNGAGVAEISIPEGYLYLQPDSARPWLVAGKNPVPKNLVGIIAPISEKWFAVLNFDNVGYISDVDQKQVDPAAILKLVRESFSRQNGDINGAASRADWEIRPAYDPAQHKLEWALKVGVPGKGSINHYISILGRHGVLNVTASHPNQAGLDFASLRTLAGGIVFKPGERYADHQTSDLPAPFGLAGVIDPEAKNAKTAGSIWDSIAGAAQSYGIWAVAALGLVLASCGFTVLVVKQRRKSRRRQANGKAHPAFAAANGHANGHSTVNGLANNHSAPSRRNGKMPGNNGRRKKHFSYHAFYSDMVMNLTRCNYGGATRSFADEDSARANGASTPGPAAVERPQSDTANLLVSEASKLIQSQQKLIEGQRKLIEEQSKLIQEKSKLIDVENRVLEKQSEMLVEQQLL